MFGIFWSKFFPLFCRDRSLFFFFSGKYRQIYGGVPVGFEIFFLKPFLSSPGSVIFGKILNDLKEKNGVTQIKCFWHWVIK